MARNLLGRFGYAGVDLRKDVGTGMLLPGHVRSLLENLRINCVLDVGANRGQYATMLRHFGYTGRIVSVEPLPDVYEELSRAASSDSNEWRTLNVALGAEEGIKQFNVYSARDLSSFLSPAADMGDAVLGSDIVAVRNVRVTTVDRILGEAVSGIDSPRVFLKMDTQGYDVEVINGAMESLGSILALQTELSVIPLYERMPNYVAALAHFHALGFTPTGFFNVVGHRLTRRTIEFDAILVRDAAVGA